MDANTAARSFQVRAAQVCAWCVLLFAIPGVAQTSQKLHKHVPPVVSNGHARQVGTVPVQQKIQLAIVLPVRNQAGLTSLLGQLYDPSSPNYRHFLTVQQFTDQFGPTAQDYDGVVQWATSNGFTIVSQSKNRLVLNVSGTAAQVNAALHVSMNTYRDPDNANRTFYSIDREPTVNLSVLITHIQGLNNYSIPEPMLKKAKGGLPVTNIVGSGPGGSYLGSDMRAAYYGGTLLTGAGQCVGLFEFGGYRLSDVNLTFANAGQAYAVPINNVVVGGSAGAGSDDSEQVLDIVQAIGMAPGLDQVRVYIGASGTGWDTNIFNTMATENACRQLSVSWGWIPDDPQTDDGIFQEFAAQGQSIFVASGDYGAYDYNVSPYFYPAEDAYVTAVGATHLTTDYEGGPWVGETAWNNAPYASGGGVSPDDIAIPSWQQTVAAQTNGASTALRNVPDVAMEGDLDNYYCDMGACGGGAGGTSFAAPRWASFMALINQQATETGAAPAGGLGFINPALYSLGQGANYGADFHDVSSGTNDSDNQPVWYSAVTGYDLVTGWGSPNGQNLINTLAGSLASGFWLSTSPASLSVAQSSSTTSTVSVIDAGGFAGNVSLTASGLPSGVTAAFNPTTTTGTAVLTLTASSSATLGTATVKITGTSGSQTSTASLFLTVNSPATNPPAGVSLGSVNVGTTSSPSTLTITFAAAGTLGSIAVLTQGVPNFDFTNAGGGSCAVGTAYAANSTCTVAVTFTPRFSGIRYAAVVLSDGSGNQLGKLYFQATGTGAQTTFIPGTQTTIGSGFLNPETVALLGDGSLYVADYGNGNGTGAVYLESYSNGSYTQSKLSCTFTTPSGVAVDSSGTIYVTDPGVPAVYKVTLANGNCSQTVVGSGFGAPWGVAVDGSGDVYITDLGTSSIAAGVYKETLQANGGYLQSAVGSGWVVPTAVAVDGNGNVDVADYAIPGVFMETPSEGSYTQTPVGVGWTAPYGIAVDGAGNIYVSDSGNNVQSGGGGIPATVVREILTSGKYLQLPIGSGWELPYGIAVDASGNLYVADDLRGVYKNDLADSPALAFANTAAGTSSSDSPKTVTVSNIGTGALQFSSVAYPADFPEASGIPTDCVSNISLPAGQSCTLSIEFLPTAALGGSTSLALNESVSITTNTLNTTATQQAMAVSGTETLPSGSVALSVSSNPTAAGTPITFTSTVTPPTGGPTPTGTVTFYNGTTAIGGPVALNSGVATYSTSSLAPGTYAILASYSGDANYQAANSNTVTESIVATPGVSGFGDTSIGTQNVGSTSSIIPLTITFTSAETLGSIAVLTEGVPNLDFANAGGGSCSIGTAYVANSTCTVNVTFTPKYPGTRYGAVVLADNNGNVIGTGYLEGTGVGAQTAFLPGTLTSVASGLGYPQGVAVDGSGNLYVADALNGAVYKEVLTNGTWTQSTVGTGFSHPYAVAIDGAGNLYIADIGNRAVYKEAPLNGSYIQTVIGSGFIWPAGVAVDAVGSVYVADFGDGVNPGMVYLETPSNGTYTQSTVGTGFVTPQGIAVDGRGNIYVADSDNGNGVAAVYELTPSNSSYTQTAIGTGWATPTGVAVDGNGNLYVADDGYDLGDGFVAKETLQADRSYVQTTVLPNTSTPYPGGVTVDGRGNLYIADNLDGTVYRDDTADPPLLSFAATMYGATSSDSPKTVTVEDAGNSALTFSALNYPADFPEALGAPSDCTSSTSLTVGATCTMTIDFTPASLGNSNQGTVLSENLAITTNSLNLGTPQAVPVSGTEAAPVATVALSVPASVATVGTSVTFTATVTGQSGFAAPTGSATFYSNGTTLGTSPLNNGTASFSTSSLAVGTYSITATYSGDQLYPSATSAAINQQIIPAVAFGPQTIGSSTSNTFTITFPSRATIGTISVVTQGMPNLDFTNAGGGTCSTGTAYAAGATCTVKVAFNPRFSGPRYGAIVLGDNKGNLIQMVYLQGTGVAPQITFPTGRQSTIEPSGYSVMTVDGNGDIYAITPANSSGVSMSVTKLTPSGTGTYTSSTISSAYDLSSASAIAVDGSGAVYIADGYVYQHFSKVTYYLRILKETLVAGQYQESLAVDNQNSNGSAAVYGIVVDGAGNMYISDFQNSLILKETPSSGSYTQSTLSTGYLVGPSEMTMDAIGNIYVHERENYAIGQPFQRIIKLAPTGGLNYSQTTIAALATWNQEYEGTAIDSIGDVYFGFYDFSVSPNSMELLKAAPSGSSYAVSPLIPARILQGPTYQLAIDGNQNLYFTTNGAVMKIDLVDPPQLSFASTNVGSTSADSPQSIQVENGGNAPLNFPVSSTGTNPSISSNFSLDGNTTTCPQVPTSGPLAALNASSSCNYGVNFVPTTSGTINGSLVLTDNALNATGATQSIPLTGMGIGNTSMAILSIGADGQRHLSWVARDGSTSAASLNGFWLDTYSRHYIAGIAEFITGTCTEVQAGNLSEIGDIVGAHYTFGYEYVGLPNNQCPGQIYKLATVSGQWPLPSEGAILDDVVSLRWTGDNGDWLANVTAKTELAQITYTSLNATSCNGQPQPSATVTLEQAPPGATGYQWEITGGNGQVHFLNGQQSIKSNDNAVPIVFPAGAQFSVTATVTRSSDKLKYGPTAYAPNAPPTLSITKLQYTNSLDVWQDGPHNPNPIAMPKTVWAAADPATPGSSIQSWPSVFVSGNTIQGTASFSISPPPAAALPGTRVEASLGNNLGSLAGCVDIPAGATSVPVNVIGNTGFPSSTTEHYSPFSATWSFSPTGQSCSSGGAQCSAAGTTSSELFVTLAQPSGMSESVMPLTAVKLAIGNGGAKNAAEALTNIWGQFSTGGGPANIAGWDGRSLIYYPAGTPFSGCALNAVGLLTSPTGGARCGAFAELFQDVLAVNGISSVMTTVTPTTDNFMLVKNWSHPQTPTFSDSGSFQWSFVSSGANEMVPPPNPATPTVYGDMTSDPGVPGQNSPTPSEKVHVNHAIVCVPVAGVFYDPSYGLTYTGPTDFENQALDGYALHFLSDAPNQYRVRMSSGVNATTFAPSSTCQ